MNAFDFDGADVPFLEGQSIGAALIDHGVVSWRVTRYLSRPRGIFCGIGVCFDCLLKVDGRPNVRACVTAARPGMEVRSQAGTGHG